MQGTGTMGSRKNYRFMKGFWLTAVIVLGAVWAAYAVTAPAVPSGSQRADLIVIDGLKAFGPLERPAVPFYHDKHTEAMAKLGKDCLACHQEIKDRLIPKFERVEDADKQTVMDIYHDKCITCHKETKTADNPSGPVTCGQCHVKEGAPPSSWQPIGLDKSLHYRHVKANDKKCETCHHAYNEKTKALFYDKGKEGACLYCHKDKTEENRISNRLASHQACLACHRKLTANNKDGGPVQCAGCHDPLQQAMIEKLDDIPRMERGQPDALLVKLYADEQRPDNPSVRMNAVPFDHKAHEGYNDSCRVCHHAELTACASCHTIDGATEGKQVKLAQAMHQRNADASCVGCHNQEKEKPTCAGCHSSIPQSRSLAAEDSCKSCHLAPLKDNRMPTGDAAAAMAAELLAARPSATGTLSVDQIPETVKIRKLSREYEPADFPHRRIVLKLAELVRDSKLAEQFHGDVTTLCQGCHHNSPASVKPPQCASCHGKTSEALNLTRPGLMAAYHQQCIQCHDKMGLEKPATRECTSCHAKRK
jgi:hypothetical protein